MPATKSTPKKTKAVKSTRSPKTASVAKTDAKKKTATATSAVKTAKKTTRSSQSKPTVARASQPASKTQVAAKSKTTQAKSVAKSKAASVHSKASVASPATASTVNPAVLHPLNLPDVPSELPVGSGFMGIPPYQTSDGEVYMNERQKTHFQHILLTWRRALVEELSRTVSQMKDEVINFPDMSDRATLEEEFSLELRARNRERKLISKIDEALEHIQEDDYGYCETCGIDIGIRRLEARPTATQCIDCKTLDEMKERQLKG